MFIHLNCHSNYSLLEGTSKINDLVRHASTLGHRALALTDTNGLYGAVSFYQSARKAGIKPILGTEIVHGTQRAVLLAKNLDGFGEVCRVITDRHLKSDFSLTQRLKECGENVIILCSDEKILRSILGVRGKENIYLEINTSSRIRAKEQHLHPLRVLSDCQLPPRRVACPMVATNRIRFALPEDWEVHRLLTAIKTSTTIHSVPQSALAPREAWMKSSEEMKHLFQNLPEAIANTLKIAEQCNVELPIGETSIPAFSLPAGSKDQHHHLKKLVWEGAQKFYSGDRLEDTIQQLRHELKVIDDLNFSSYFLIVWDIVREAKARGIPTVGRGSAANSLVCRTLDITEVDPIAHNLYFERFLNPERTDYPDIDIDFPWNRRDEMLDYVFEKYGHENVALISAHVHFRGRSALREVGKALGVPIAEIDTLTSRLPHSADLSGLDEIRDAVPECRDLPLEDEPYRSMISLSTKIDGFPRHLSIHCGGIVVSPFPITDRIPLQRTPKGFVVTQYDMYPVEDMGLLKIDLLAQKGLAVLADTVREVEKKYGRKIDFSKTNPIDNAKTQKLIREGQTMGCFYIESPGMRNLLKKLKVDSFEMLTAVSSIIRPGVSDSGMMKAFIDRHTASVTLDSTSNDSLANANSLSAQKISPKIAQTLEENPYQITLTPTLSPQGRGSAMSLLPWREKARMRGTIKTSSPSSQTNVSAPPQTIANRPHGEWMEEILKDTYGIMIYQEDVIKVAHQIGGMSLGEADSLRKCMSKKRDWQDINTYRERFVSGAIQNGVQKKEAEEIWRQIESFAGYAFCKAHSASFAIVSYQSAYLKAHYPAEFMAAVLSNRGGFYDACAYTEEARRMGIKILPPDVNLSDAPFTATNLPLDPTGNNPKTKGSLDSKNHCLLSSKQRPFHKPIRLKNEMLRQAQHDNKKPFCHSEEQRDEESRGYTKPSPQQAVRVGLSQVKGLSQNSTNEIRKNRPFTSFADFLSRTKISASETDSLIRCGAFNTLYKSKATLLWQLKLHHRKPRLNFFPQHDKLIPKLPDYTLREKLLAELECLDLTVSEHLLSLYSFHNNKLAETAICGNQLEKFSGKLVTLIGWAITYKRTRTVKNELMKFMTLEDKTATFEVTLFPRVYKRFGHLLYDRGPYIIRGRVEREDNTTTALWIGRLQEAFDFTPQSL